MPVEGGLADPQVRGDGGEGEVPESDGEHRGGDRRGVHPGRAARPAMPAATVHGGTVLDNESALSKLGSCDALVTQPGWDRYAAGPDFAVVTDGSIK
ncbi:hypothetical protein GCM10009828_082140 [Actinoplanes couchii]|uniref:Uncharacterized protein n=1 Tax=Actinoplanes couchii TaxID=403638 RepID=A0ABQ3XKX2_9ACTN|nr:hypothetical protein Aco03nite_075610 [Actinoplanes couchii]